MENRIAISNSLRPYPNYFKYNLHQVKWAPLPDTSSRKRKTNYKFSCSQFAHQKKSEKNKAKWKKQITNLVAFNLRTKKKQKKNKAKWKK